MAAMKPPQEMRNFGREARENAPNEKKPHLNRLNSSSHGR